MSDQAAQWLLQRARQSPEQRPSSSSMPAECSEPRRTTLFVRMFYRSEGAAMASRSVSSRISVGGGESLSRALDAALAGLPQLGNIGEPDRIAIDILDADPVPIDATGIGPEQTVSQLIDVGVEGLAMETGGRTLYLMPSDFIYESIAL